MHSDYDHLYIPLLPKKANSSYKPTFFCGNNNPFSIEPTVVWVKISEKKKLQFLWFEISLRQASKSKETYFAIRKVLKNFEEHDHWH